MVQKINKLLATTLLCSAWVIPSVNAKEIYTNMARMQAMDKITGKVSEIDVPVNGETRFGSFSITVRECATRPPEETPENFAFVDIIDDYNINTKVNIFRGWMISSSPALNAVEHPIYDVWLLYCYNGDLKGKHLLTQEELREREEIAKGVEVSNTKVDEKVAELKASTEKVDHPEDEKVSSDDQVFVDDEDKAKIEPLENVEIKSVEMKGLDEGENKPLESEAESSAEEPSVTVDNEESQAPKNLINLPQSLENMVKNVEKTVSDVAPEEPQEAEVAPKPVPQDVLSSVAIVKTEDDKLFEEKQKELREKAADEEALRRQQRLDALKALSQPSEENKAPDNLITGNTPQNQEDDIIIEEIEEDGFAEEDMDEE